MDRRRFLRLLGITAAGTAGAVVPKAALPVPLVEKIVEKIVPVETVRTVVRPPVGRDYVDVLHQAFLRAFSKSDHPAMLRIRQAVGMLSGVDETQPGARATFEKYVKPVLEGKDGPIDQG